MILRVPGIVLPLLLLAACSGDTGGAAPAEEAAQMTVTGSLTYRERIALLPGASARVTLSDVSIADRAAPVLAEMRIALDDRQVLIPFSLEVERAQFEARGRYALRGTIVDAAGRLLWTTDSLHLIDPALAQQDLGALTMVRVQAAATPAAGQLRGGEWVVEDIGRRGLIDSSRVTLTFGDDGRLSGMTGCNSYSAPYEASGNNLAIGQALATLRACAPALGNQERAFLRLLGEVTRFGFDGTGALILTTASGETLTARR